VEGQVRPAAAGMGIAKITCDLREAGERCSRHRVRRLMKREGLRAQRLRQQAMPQGCPGRHGGQRAGLLAWFR